MLNLKDIKNSKLCLGCGLCESFAPECKMITDRDGFVVPDTENVISGKEGDLLQEMCPAINLVCIKPSPTLFGKVRSILEGWSTNPSIRYKASSGGVISALCCYLLENRIVEGIIQVRKSPGHYMKNEMHVSTTSYEVIEAAASRYAPVSMFKDIKNILETEKIKTYAFVGKPCDVMTISRLIDRFPEWKNRIKYKISLVCAGTPSYNATLDLVDKGKKSDKAIPENVKYRGEGWPGKFEVNYSDNTKFELDYNESWGKVLGRNLNFRCKICPDGIGNFADVVVGDSWETKDGYPDFSENDGRCFVLVRTEVGEDLVNSAIADNYIAFRPLELNKLKYIQPYQFQRLEYAAWKLLGAKFCVPSLLKIKNLKFSFNNILRGTRIMYGTIKRFRKQ